MKSNLEENLRRNKGKGARPKWTKSGSPSRAVAASPRQHPQWKPSGQGSRLSPEPSEGPRAATHCLTPCLPLRHLLSRSLGRKLAGFCFSTRVAFPGCSFPRRKLGLFTASVSTKGLFPPDRPGDSSPAWLGRGVYEADCKSLSTAGGRGQTGPPCSTSFSVPWKLTFRACRCDF